MAGLFFEIYYLNMKGPNKYLDTLLILLLQWNKKISIYFILSNHMIFYSEMNNTCILAVKGSFICFKTNHDLFLWKNIPAVWQKNLSTEAILCHFYIFTGCKISIESVPVWFPAQIVHQHWVPWLLYLVLIF